LRSFWSVQERLRAIFFQYGPKPVGVNKKFIVWPCLTLYYLKSEQWQIGMKETVNGKAFKTQQFYFTHTQKNYIAQGKSKNFKYVVSFHSASNNSNY